MRVPRTPTDLLNRRTREKRRASAPQRRGEGRAGTPAVSAAPERSTDLREERRMRESGGPDDRAHYRCNCGYAFEADVSTSVACPHCGTDQAW